MWVYYGDLTHKGRTIAQNKAKMQVSNRVHSPSTDDSRDREITGQRLARSIKLQCGMWEASGEQFFKDFKEGRFVAASKGHLGRFQDGGYSRKTKKDQTGSKAIRPPDKPIFNPSGGVCKSS